jgi:ABC-type lipoprotein export system ATPase subunit
MLDNYSIPSKNKRNNSPLLPDSIRACIVGKSGCGKTNLLLNLLLNDYLDYDHLYIFDKSLHQPE